MEDRNLFLGILFLLILFLFLTGCAKQEINKNPLEPQQNQEQNTEEETSGQGQPSTQEFTMEEIANHNTKEDCWLLISGKVYDVTKMIGGHPGGAAILEGCGKDATTLFETRPMGSGTPHSERARSGLEKYYIGEVK